MKQVTQNFKTGQLKVEDVPPPMLTNGRVLIENRCSLISAGTEKGTVKVGQASLLGKARQRPELVKQVIQNYRREGLSATLQKVRTKLDSPKALGYSSTGVVAASLDYSGILQPGDRVACGGQDYASHAEFVSVPQNLVVKIPEKVSFQEAAFTTLGAIALQGVRQAEPTIGENIAVIGLGLLGQISCQLLKANGCNVFGIDVSEYCVSVANKNDFARAILRNSPHIIQETMQFTRGNGFDKVIITASSPTSDPIDLASEILRKKGKVVVVGSVQMNLQRDPHFYRKELELVMSCSYGPGRYDTTYEEAGQDYPYAYVRWTEQRNMEAFLDLINNGRIHIAPLITHQFQIEEAEKAYNMITEQGASPYLGILLNYPQKKQQAELQIQNEGNSSNAGSIAFIGAGSFAQSYLLPHVSKHGELHSVITLNGLSSQNIAKKFNFQQSVSDPLLIFKNPQISSIFIATRHNSHAQWVIEGLKSGKNVYVEKPLCLSREELSNIEDTIKNTGNSRLMVGFNRRFSPLAGIAKQFFQEYSGPMQMAYRINAGALPPDHWLHTNEGGGRIIGEVCHFVDLMQYLSGAYPVQVSAMAIHDHNASIPNSDNVNVQIQFNNGSTGSILYTALGNNLLPKERLEIFGGEKTFVLDDFKKATLYDKSIKNIKKPGKGHEQEVQAFFNATKKGGPMPIPFSSIRATTLTTFAIQDSISTGLPQIINI